MWIETGNHENLIKLEIGMVKGKKERQCHKRGLNC
jgi:hypothetical protein